MKCDNFIAESEVRDIKRLIQLSHKARYFVAFILFMIPTVFSFFNIGCIKDLVYLSAGIILIFNIILGIFLKKHINKEHCAEQKKSLKNLGANQIIFDFIFLTLVLIAIHGLHSALFMFYCVHIIIGTLILSKRYIFLLISIISVMYWISFFFYHTSSFIDVPTKNSDAFFLWGTFFLVSLSCVLFIDVFTKKVLEERKRLSETSDTLEQNFLEIKEIEARKSKFMRYSAHQLRSPLATIISALHVIENKMVPLDTERAFNIVVQAHERANELLKIVNDLLRLVQIREEVRKKNEIVDTNLISLMEEIIFFYRHPILEKKLKIFRNYQNNDETIEMKRMYLSFEELEDVISKTFKLNFTTPNLDHLSDAFNNVFENAIKYSPSKKEIHVSILLKDKKLIFSIEDQGIGICPDYQKEIFIEFVRSPEAKDFEKQGTGLGLSIVKEVMDKHNAKIELESELEKGSKFTFTFDLSKKITIS